MTLIQFFERIRSKAVEVPYLSTRVSAPTMQTVGEVISIHAYHMVNSVKRGDSFKAYQMRDRKESWRYIVKHTHGTDFWDEFRGDKLLKEELQKFLTYTRLEEIDRPFW